MQDSTDHIEFIELLINTGVAGEGAKTDDPPHLGGVGSDSRELNEMKIHEQMYGCLDQR